MKPVSVDRHSVRGSLYILANLFNELSICDLRFFIVDYVLDAFFSERAFFVFPIALF